jgi:CBS domain-containing protein
MVRDVVTVKEDITIQEAIRILWEKHIGSVIVTDSRSSCMGIFTERDAIRVVAQKVDLTVSLGNVMTKKVVTVDVDATLHEVRMLIAAHRIRHLPVVDDKGKLVGLFAIRAIVDEFFGV